MRYISGMAMSDYQFDHLGRPIHRELYELAQEITFAADKRGGKFELYEIPLSRWQRLEREAAYANGGSSLADRECGRMNFIWRGVPVCPFEEPE